MRYLIDAQISFKLSKMLLSKGYDVTHTDDLPKKEFTTDNEIRNISLNENRIVVTKDADFLDSYLIKRVPPKLLLITAGNLKNTELFNLIETYFEQIHELFSIHSFIELNKAEIIVHE